MADKAAERIKFETEMLRLTALVAVASGGSSLGLLMGDHTLLRLGLATIGIVATIILATTVLLLYRRIRGLIDAIEETPWV